MEYREAKAIGDVGERRVADQLRLYCEQSPPAGFLSNLLLRVGTMTAQLDHVLVDSHGILIVEVKVRNGLIRGTVDEKKWTAVYHGMTKTFQNPLEQLRGQRNTLSKALHGVSDSLDLDLIQSVVVFVDADIRLLELDSHGRARVTSVERLAALLRARTELGTAGLSHVELCRRYEQLRLLDQSADPAVQASHAAYRGGANVPAAPVVALPAPKRRPVVTFSGNPHRPGAAATPEPFSWPGAGRPTSRASQKRRAAGFQLAVICALLLCAMTGIFGSVVNAAVKSFASSMTSGPAAPAQAPR